MRVWTSGDCIDGHTLVRLLGGGSRAEVWAAEGPSGTVALKLARADWDRARLRKEALLLGRCEHPGVVGVVDLEPSGRWFSMPLLPGPSIVDWSAEAGHSRRLAALVEVADAVSALHDQGIFHGDLKPCNVLMGAQQHAVVLDLGLASEPPAEVRAGFHGTLGWASPEQLAGRAPDAASDVYGLGRLAWRVLRCGEAGRTGRSAVAACGVGRELPPEPRLRCPALSPAQATLLLDMIAVEPGERPALDRVRQVLAAPPSTQPPPADGEVWEGLRRALERVLRGGSVTVQLEAGDALVAEVRPWLEAAVRRSGVDARIAVGPPSDRSPSPRPGVPTLRLVGGGELDAPVSRLTRLHTVDHGLEDRVLALLSADGPQTEAQLAARLGLGALDLADLLDALQQRGMVGQDGLLINVQERESR